MAVYLFTGDDEELKGRQVEKLRGDRPAETFDAADASPESVVSACNSFSLFGEATFVLVKNLDAWNAAQKAKVVVYLEEPSEGSDLVLTGRKIGARERLLSAVNKAGKAHEFKQPTGKALVKWATGHAKKLGLTLPQEVAEELSERCSGDKARLVKEIEKLSLYTGEGTATLQDVDALCAPSVQSNIFAFVDSLAAGDRGRSVEMLDKLLASGEPPLRVLFMIRRQFTLVARSKALLDRGVPRGEVSKDLKVAPFVARKLEEQGAGLSEADLERALAAILNLERGLKGGSNLPDALQMELAVLSLSGGRS